MEFKTARSRIKKGRAFPCAHDATRRCHERANEKPSPQAWANAGGRGDGQIGDKEGNRYQYQTWQRRFSATLLVTSRQRLATAGGLAFPVGRLAGQGRPVPVCRLRRLAADALAYPEPRAAYLSVSSASFSSRRRRVGLRK